MPEPRRLHLILLAGGSGNRAGGGSGSLPKQFQPTGRGVLFTVSLRSFLELDPASGFAVAGVTLAVAEPWASEAKCGLAETLEAHGELPWQLAPSGATRTDSTWQAAQVLAQGYRGELNGAAPADCDLVAVHDTARPFAGADLLLRLAQGADETGGAIPGIPVPDTIVRVPESAGTDSSAVYLKRELLQAVQTPQVFRWDLFHSAHAAAAADGLDFTDDGGLLASRGHHPVVVAGETDNWKVTTEADLLRAKELLG